MNRSSLISPLLLSAAVAGFASPASASSSVDPNVLRALDLGSMQSLPTRVRAIAPRRAQVLIELDGPLSAATRARLQKAGVTIGKRAGRAVGLQRFVAASIDRATLKNLEAMPEVRRISHVPPRGPLPLQYTTGLLDLASARGAHDSIDQLTGRGMLVADTDSNADVFHPHFFHADGGYYDWIDVNDNDVFDPGIDAVDFDADGKPSPEEVGLALPAGTYTYYGSSVPARNTKFDPGLDWVYLDDNDNGKRDYGAEAGFNDDVPAFGEPIFVPDDVNQNGKLDVGERLVRLGTSKLRKVHTSVSSGYLTETRIYERGVDLSSHVNEISGSGGDASHGTSVLSILLGDVPLVGRRNVGLAPEAEAVLAADLGGAGVEGAAWMLDEKPDVALWEMAPWVSLPLDGTDPYSQLVDATALGDDIVHACPVGNTGGARKHAFSRVPAGQMTTISFENPPQLDPKYIQMSLNIRGAANLRVHLHAPDGTEIELTANAGQQFELKPGIAVYPTVQTTLRGTYFVDTLLYAYQPQVEMPQGEWQLEIDGDASDDATLNAYVMDEISGWGEGVRFSEELSTDASTIGAPAAADHAIAVGAFTGHPSTTQQSWFYGDEPAGYVRGYSGRGPRIDGTARLDVVAPDNPFAAAPATPDYYGYGEVPHGGFWVFGGTSGAGPHVAGVALLLAQAGIRGDAAREAIRAGATNDAVTLADPEAYGAGRLNAAGALGVEPSAGTPTVSVELDPSPAVVGQEATLRLTLADPENPASSLVTRWDDGYDGTWDTPYESGSERTVIHDQVGKYPYKVRVRNPGGRVAEAVIWVEVAEGSPGALDAGVDGGEEDGGTSSPAVSASPLEAGGGGCGCRVSGETERASHGALLLVSLLGVAIALGRKRR